MSAVVVENQNRTLSFSVVAKDLAHNGTALQKWDIGAAHFPKLGSQLSKVVQWRVRSARATWDPIDTTQGGSIGLLVTHGGAAWRPADNFHDFKTRGGIIKPIRSAGWSSNTLGATEAGWVDSSASCGCVYALAVPGREQASHVGMVTLHLVIQVAGNKE